jgi:hypothetical protein
MKQITQTFKFKKDCKHLVVFEPVLSSQDEFGIASSIYVDRRHLPVGTREIKLTLCVPEGGQDANYINL